MYCSINITDMCFSIAKKRGMVLLTHEIKNWLSPFLTFLICQETKKTSPPPLAHPNIGSCLIRMRKEYSHLNGSNSALSDLDDKCWYWF